MMVAVDLRCEVEPRDRLVVHLREGDAKTSVAVRPAQAGATSLLRPIDAALFRTVFFNRPVKSGKFPTAERFKPFDPIDGPETTAAARDRLAAARQRYLDACTACAQKDGKVTGSVFGAVPLADYMRFTTMHTRHHQKQIPSA